VVSFFFVVSLYQEKEMTMTKAQIIDEYNSLTSELNNELNQYYELTGVQWSGNPRHGNMSPGFLNYGKESLESFLCGRKSTIYSIRGARYNYTNTQKLKSTPEGRDFLSSLATKRQELTDSRDRISKEMFDAFNILLRSCGLLDWEMGPMEIRKVVPAYDAVCFDVYNTKVRGSQVHIEIRYVDKKWRMRLNAAVRGSEEISDRGEQYQWYKGYVTIADNYELFQNWMETKYHTLAHQAYEIKEELDDCEQAIDNPYRAWIKLQK